MTEKSIQPKEDLLLVFVSSSQDPEDKEMSRARSLTIKEVGSFPLDEGLGL